MEIARRIDPALIQTSSPSDFLFLREASHGGRLGASDLNELLGTQLPPEGLPTRDQLNEVLDAVSQTPRLEKIIHSILSDPEELARITARAFGHSIGMERIEIASHGPYTLRLHYWMPGKNVPITEDPHNHAYNFGSKVLAGHLVTDLFRIGEDGTPMNMYEIATQTGLEKPVPTQIDEVLLQTITPPDGIVLSTGDPSYTMVDNVIHRIRQWDPQHPIITLNLRGKAVKEHSRFFRNETMRGANPAPVSVDVEDRLSLLLHELTKAR